VLLVVVGQRSRLWRFIGNERWAFLAQPLNSLSGTKRYRGKRKDKELGIPSDWEACAELLERPGRGSKVTFWFRPNLNQGSGGADFKHTLRDLSHGVRVKRRTALYRHIDVRDR